MSDLDCDAVVIGSGFGGAVTAYRLAAAGHAVVLLERGRAWPPGSFPRTPRTLRDDGFWDPAEGRHGLFDVWSFGGLSAIVASGLGGGSLIYANVMLKKDPATFVKERLQDGGRERWPIDAADLDDHYTNVFDMQRPEPYPWADRTPKTRAFRAACDDLGLPVVETPLAVAFGSGPGEPVPGENLHGVPRRTCRLCGECDLGCNDGAKSTLDLTYLTAARDAGAQIRTLCEARTLRRLDGGGWEVGYHQRTAARAGTPDHLLDPDDAPSRTVRARIAVVSAGVFGTLQLLLSNRGRLPGLSPALGTRFCTNGDLLAFARDTAEPLDPSVGPVITTSARLPDDVADAGREMLLQDAGSPQFAEWLWQMQEAPRDALAMAGTVGRRIAQRVRGRRDTRLGGEFAQALGTTTASSRMLPLLGMGRDHPTGRFRLRGTTLELDWDIEDSGAYFDAMEGLARRVAEGLGGRFEDRDPFHRLRLVTVHPLGGAPMGETWRDGVVDDRGEVFRHPGLFVADGSILPGPVGANPSATIAAVADRCAERMIEVLEA